MLAYLLEVSSRENETVDAVMRGLIFDDMMGPDVPLTPEQLAEILAED